MTLRSAPAGLQTERAAASGPAVCLLTAVRNEERQIEPFLREIHHVLREGGMLPRAHLVIVDDYSIDATREIIADTAASLDGLSVQVIELPSNRGNQSAMAYGLRLMAERFETGHVLTFDADGEDDLTQVPQLVRMLDKDPGRMLFVYRDRRRDGWVIRAFYAAYRLAYRLLTGQRLIPCNMMGIPGSMVAPIAGSPLLPLHFSYPPLRLGLPYHPVPLAKRARYGGRSSQNLGLLIQHGLIGLTIFYEQVVARLILLSAAVVGVTGLAALWVAVVRLTQPRMLPTGLTTAIFVSLIGFGFMSIVLLVVFCMASAIFRLLMEQNRPE
jgi:glycosyltransferase involved in cell wall biosynthesis